MPLSSGPPTKAQWQEAHLVTGAQKSPPSVTLTDSDLGLTKEFFSRHQQRKLSGAVKERASEKCLFFSKQFSDNGRGDYAF